MRESGPESSAVTERSQSGLYKPAIPLPGPHLYGLGFSLAPSINSNQSRQRHFALVLSIPDLFSKAYSLPCTMYSFVWLAALLAPALAAPSASFPKSPRAGSGSGYTVAHGGSKVVVTKDNTLNGTIHHRPEVQLVSDAQAGSLPLTFVNNFSGDQVYAYVQGQDSTGAIVFIDQNGDTVYPSSGGSTTPVEITEDIAIPVASVGGQTALTIPIVMTSARIYFSEGELTFYMVATSIGDGLVQPAPYNIDGAGGDLNWGFMELTYTTAEAVYANLSYVDFVGMILSMMLSSTDGTSQTVEGLSADSKTSICSELAAQTASDGWPWASECITNANGELIRVLSPVQYESIDAADATAFDGYWTSYVEQVWSTYTTSPLTIDTQDPTYGEVSCQVSGSTMTCSGGDNLGYAMPDDDDIWGCNTGPFSQANANALHLLVIPRLCAAFDRSTLLLSGGNVQPSLPATDYYTVEPTNHYAKAIHDYETDGKGYAFSYDDVHSDSGTDPSGLISTATPAGLTIYVGGQ